ncbi:hypothetical protein BDN70DRAFT_797457 [Pholiota conissans]|uniref:Uncharacterized protein n=1 Tax=Pholiota conissans TaxID=109636 RepID=A0A9P5ZD94_9AGAR|nr:hypothetical protein BDN70DRAFT_797457 [Pholiota conissans]
MKNVEEDVLEAVNRIGSQTKLALTSDDDLPASLPRPQPPPTSLRPKLPTEVLDIAFSMLSKNHLKPLLYTNSFISALAIRRLYSDVVLARPAVVVAFLTTVLKSERLPLLVRSLDINATNKALPTKNFYALLARGLRRMPGLVSLTLELPKPHSPLWIFDGCTFRLTQFTTSMCSRRALARFLETQPAITELTLRGYQTESLIPPIISASGRAGSQKSKGRADPDAFILREGAMPNLRAFNTVHADEDLVRTIMEGRPVSVVSIPLFADTSAASLDALCSSSTPLRRLSAISFDPTTPEALFEALAKRFVDLEALHLVLLTAEYDQQVLRQCAVALSNFRCLKYITFMAASSRPPTANPPTQPVAAQWHQACPTLKTIILPEGRVWFRSQGKSHSHGSAAAPSVTAAVVAATGGGDAGGAQEGGSGSQPQMVWAAL